MRRPISLLALAPALALSCLAPEGSLFAESAADDDERPRRPGQPRWPDPTTSTTGEDATSSSTAGDTTGGCDFVCPPDTCAGPCAALCDPWRQDCPRGQKCAAFDGDGDGSWDSLACVEVMGDGMHGDPCALLGEPAGGEDTCAKGHMCWHTGHAGGEGTCLALCTGSPERAVCAPGTSCLIANQGVLNLCMTYCDPVAQDCAKMGGDKCSPAGDGVGFFCILDGGGEHLLGTPCWFANQCNRGLFCTVTARFPGPYCEDSIGCCAPFCDLDAPECPQEPPGLECLPWYEPGAAPEGLEHVGACLIPM